MPVATAKMFGSKMMSSGGKPLVHQQAVGALADLDLAREGVGLPFFVEGHHDHGGAVAAAQLGLAQEFSSPSFIEIELTMPLPCTHFRPASITSTWRSRS
jgi:hypothetical protein